jgi:hypothetical protein
MRSAVFLSCSFLLLSISVFAGEADVVDVTVRHTGENTYRFDVAVSHADEGWDHYANRWEVIAPSGAVLGTRRLAHPHITEQPFTRSLSGVTVPEGISRVAVRANDSVHGNGGREMSVEVPR